MVNQKYTYKIIEHIAHRGAHSYEYSYITTPYDLTLEHADDEEGTPAKLWIGSDTFIEFENEVELVPWNIEAHNG